MAWPQITYIVIAALSLGIVLARHGEPREAYSFWHAVTNSAISFGLLYAGGFFNV